MHRVRIGIAGCGTIARSVHIPILRHRHDVEICALAESDKAALVEANRVAGRARPFATLDEMLAKSQLDAVIVALPTDAHASASRAVLEAGCDLYVEKPLASSVSDSAAVVDAWRQSGRIGMMGFNARFNPLLLRLRELLRTGRAGHAVYARTVFSTAPRSMPVWKQCRSSGGGALLDLGAHHIDLVRFLFEREVVAVRATVDSRVSEDDTVLLELELADGPRVHSFFSLAAAEHEQVQVFGERARLSVSRFTSLDVAVIDNPGAGGGVAGRLVRRARAIRHLGAALHARRSPLREPGYAVALDKFIAAVKTRRLAKDAADLADGHACMAVIDAAERSAQSGRMERIHRYTAPEQHIATSLQETGS